jgi:hypothetical protein
MGLYMDKGALKYWREVWYCWKSGIAGSLVLLEVWYCWKSGIAGT